MEGCMVISLIKWILLHLSIAAAQSGSQVKNKVSWYGCAIHVEREKDDYKKI